MKWLRKELKWVLYLSLLPVLYLVLSLIASSITIDREDEGQALERSIYLGTNGVHLDIILPKRNVEDLLLADLRIGQADQYLAFGWGDENFYLNTPTWSDLTIKNAFTALFLNSPSLMHVTRYRSRQADWIEIKVSDKELRRLTQYLQGSFRTDEQGRKLLLEGKGYSRIDAFYQAHGSYSCFNTCNSWANAAFKQSGLKASLWTPFDFGLMNQYR